jgi:inner membrane protein
VFRRGAGEIGRLALFAYLFLATASHGVLDAMTNSGLGVAFFSPFDNSRYFLPWRPIRVSPIAVTRFFSARGYAILKSELIWIWVPAFLFATVAQILLCFLSVSNRSISRWNLRERFRFRRIAIIP